MAEHGGPVRPLGDDAVAVSSKKMHRYIISSSNSNCNSNSKNTRQQQEQQQRQQQKGPSSLVSRCMAVLVANLERYPPSVLGMLAENEWNDLIATKHEKTAPRQGTGGLDGTGRRTPALSERFLREVETANPHLAESKCADTLIWKDCVECQFKRDGLTRPRALLLPWPLLVQQIVDLSDVLVAYKTQEDELDKEGHQLALTEEVSANITEATMALKESPMNVTLLKDSGIGKVLKKLIKASSSRSKKSIFKRLKLPTTNLPARTAVAANVKEVSVLKQLERLLQAWMDLAASQGIAISSNSSSPPRKGDMTTSFEKDQQDLQRAETCNTWRKLFAVLKDRADQRRFHLDKKCAPSVKTKIPFVLRSSRFDRPIHVANRFWIVIGAKGPVKRLALPS